MNTRTITDIRDTQVFDETDLLFCDMPEFGDHDAERLELERMELPIWAQDELIRQDLQAASAA